MWNFLRTDPRRREKGAAEPLFLMWIVQEGMGENMSVGQKFAKYVSQNVLGMIGISLYILADTFFISKAVGAAGITALNLVLPIYNLIFAVGAMLGVGSAIRYAVAKGRGDGEASDYFSNALIWGTVFGILFMIPGGLLPGKIVALLGGDAKIVAVGAPYTRIFMMFSPCFIWNSVCNAFVRNDGAPGTAMAATLLSSLFNIVMDYVLMFPLGLGMEGAAFATACSPIVGVLICGAHLCSKKCGVTFRFRKPSAKQLYASCQVGVSAFVGEISSGVITVAFNMIILRLAGNIGVAAYGVVANTSLVAVSMFNGVAQGAQPLLSEFYGKGAQDKVRKVIRLGIMTSLALAVLIVVGVYFGADDIAAVFNSERDAQLAQYAGVGLRLYFTGFLFAGINITGTGILSATESARWAFATSILRGFALILIAAFGLSALFGMRGVWLAFPAAEAVTLAVTAAALKSTLKRSCDGQWESKLL